MTTSQAGNQPPEDDGALRTGAVAALAAGAIVAGRYRLEAPLGAGGFGAVWRARNLDLERDVALKFLHPELARDPELQKRFLREVDVATRFVHRYAVQVRDAGRDPTRGLLYLTMDLVQGRTLAEALKEGPLAAARAARLMAQALEALHEAHRSGLVHRDLKPQNLMLTRGPDGEEEVRVLDFGIARAFDGRGASSGHTLTAAGAVLGTIAYMSPEQAVGKPLDARSDVYSLGVTLYQALSGQLPHQPDPGASNPQLSLLMQIATAPARDLGQVAPGVPQALAAAVMRALQRDPAARFADAGAFRGALLQAVSGADLGAEVTRPPLSPADPSRTGEARTGEARTGEARTGGLAGATPAQPTGAAPPVDPLVPTVAEPPPPAGGPAAAMEPRLVGIAIARALVMVIGAAPVGFVAGLVIALLMWGLGHGALTEAGVVGGICAGMAAGLALLMTVLEEVALRLGSRPRRTFLLLTLGLWLLALVGAAGFVAAGELRGGEWLIVALVLALVALPFGLVGLARLGGLPGLRGATPPAPALLLFTGGLGLAIWALQDGPLREPLEMRRTDPCDRAGVLVLLLGFALGGGAALIAGDALARRLRLDPRPLPGAPLVRGLSWAAWALLGLASLLALLLTRGFSQGIDLRRPVIELTEPAEWTTVPVATVTLRGRVHDGSWTRLELEPIAWEAVARVEVPLDADGVFELPFTLRPGGNHLRLVATDAQGNLSDLTRTIYLQELQPEQDGGGKGKY